MRTGQRRSALSYIPGLTNNTVLQLIIFLSVAYILFALTWGVMMLVYQSGINFNFYFIPNIALPQLAMIKQHWWTIFTYGLFNFPNGFWELFSNMLWLYCFGSVIQMVAGPRQVIPLFIYCIIIGAIFYIPGQLIPVPMGKLPQYVMGPRAGIMGMAAAAVTLTPGYRFYLGPTFSIPLLAVAGVYALLMIVASGFCLPVIVMIAGGGLAGFGYARLYKSGSRPGDWMYRLTRGIAGLVTPKESTGTYRR